MCVESMNIKYNFNDGSKEQQNIMIYDGLFNSSVYDNTFFVFVFPVHRCVIQCDMHFQWFLYILPNSPLYSISTYSLTLARVKQQQKKADNIRKITLKWFKIQTKMDLSYSIIQNAHKIYYISANIVTRLAISIENGDKTTSCILINNKNEKNEKIMLKIHGTLLRSLFDRNNNFICHFVARK